MRIIEQIEKIEDAIPNLTIKAQNENTQPVQIRVTNINKIRDSLLILQSTGIFDIQITQIKNTFPIIFSTANYYISLTESQFIKYKSLIEEVENVAILVLNSLKDVSDYDNQHKFPVLSIKVPPSYKTIVDVTNFTKDLDFVFRNVIPNKQVSFKGFDVGTDWIRFCIEDAESLAVFSLFIKQAYTYVKYKMDKIRMEKHHQKIEISETVQDLPADKAKQVLASILELQEKQYRLALAQEVVTKEDIQERNEQLNGIEKSIEKFATLILKHSVLVTEKRITHSEEEEQQAQQVEIPTLERSLLKEIKQLLIEHTESDTEEDVE